jgi:hypothetical protein
MKFQESVTLNFDLIFNGVQNGFGEDEGNFIADYIRSLIAAPGLYPENMYRPLGASSPVFVLQDYQVVYSFLLVYPLDSLNSPTKISDTQTTIINNLTGENTLLNFKNSGIDTFSTMTSNLAVTTYGVGSPTAEPSMFVSSTPTTVAAGKYYSIYHIIMNSTKCHIIVIRSFCF